MEPITIEQSKLIIYNELLALNSPLNDMTLGSVLNSLLQALSTSHVYLQSNYINTLNSINVSTAQEEELTAIAGTLGYSRKEGIEASGYIIARANTGEYTINSIDTIINLRTGLTYTLDIIEEIEINNTIEKVIAVKGSKVGSEYNLESGSVLYLITDGIVNQDIDIRVGYSRTSSGEYCGDITNGSLTESDDSLRNRVLSGELYRGTCGSEGIKEVLLSYSFISNVWILNRVPGIAEILIRAFDKITPANLEVIKFEVEKYIPAGITYVINLVKPILIDIVVQISPFTKNSRIEDIIKLRVENYFNSLGILDSFIKADLQLELSSLGNSITIIKPTSNILSLPDDTSVFQLGTLEVIYEVI